MMVIKIVVIMVIITIISITIMIIITIVVSMIMNIDECRLATIVIIIVVIVVISVATLCREMNQHLRISSWMWLNSTSPFHNGIFRVRVHAHDFSPLFSIAQNPSFGGLEFFLIRHSPEDFIIPSMFHGPTFMFSPTQGKGSP